MILSYIIFGSSSGHLDALLRGLVLGRLGKCGHPETVAEAQKRFAAHCTGESVLPADLRTAVYSTVLKAGDQTTLEAVLKLLRDADLHEERVRLMRCMGSVSKPELINQVLNFSLSVSDSILILRNDTFQRMAAKTPLTYRQIPLGI